MIAETDPMKPRKIPKFWMFVIASLGFSCHEIVAVALATISGIFFSLQ